MAAENYWFDEEFLGERELQRGIRLKQKNIFASRPDWAEGFTVKASGDTGDETTSDFGLLVQKTNMVRGPKKHHRRPNGCKINLVVNI